jgi:hypothetical protein
LPLGTKLRIALSYGRTLRHKKQAQFLVLIKSKNFATIVKIVEALVVVCVENCVHKSRECIFGYQAVSVMMQKM